MKTKILWGSVNSMIGDLTLKIQGAKLNLENIYGIPRGGLVLAVILSHRLNLPIILDKEKISKHTLVVDDIADSGRTFKKLLNGKILTTVSLAKRHTSIFEPTFYYMDLIDDTWLVLPWETDKSSKYDYTI